MIIDKNTQKQIKKLPGHIVQKLQKWTEDVEKFGIEEIRIIPGYHDEPLKCEALTQKDFATLLGISAQSLCDIEKGRKMPSVTRAAKIANLINEPEKTWIRLALQDMLRKGDLRYTVSLT